MTSPPFKPFAPLPPSRVQRPPTPPENIYKNSFSHLLHPTPNTQARVLEIIENPDRRNIEIVKDQWKRRDEEREKELQEKREQRTRLLNGAVPIPAPVVQAPPSLSTAPRPPPKKKARKSLFASLFGRRDDPNTGLQPSAASVAATSPRPSIYTSHMSPHPSMRVATPAHSEHVTMPTPAVIPSPFMRSPGQPPRSTTPPFSPLNPNPGFVEITPTNKYAGFLPMSSHPVAFSPPDTHVDPSQAQVETWPTAAHLYLASQYFNVKPNRVKTIKKTAVLDEVMRLVEGRWNDENVREDWETVKSDMASAACWAIYFWRCPNAKFSAGRHHVPQILPTSDAKAPVARDREPRVSV